MKVAEEKELSSPEHWDSRYAGKREDGLGEHEWFRTFADLQPFLTKYLPTIPIGGHDQSKILHLGCGTSELTRRLYELGYHAQYNIDFSPVAIDSMSKLCDDLDGTQWEVMDVRNMRFQSDTFDVAIDKGTLDAMLWGSLWDPADEVKANVGAYVDEVARCLKPGGLWLYITFRQPHFIRPLLERPGLWTLFVEDLGAESNTLGYFGWIMRKKE